MWPQPRVAIASPFLAAEAEGGSVGVADIISRGRGSGFGPPWKGLRFMGCAVERAKLSFFKEGWRGNELGGVAGEILDLEMDRRFGRRTGVCVKP